MNNQLGNKIREIEKNVEKYVVTGFSPMAAKKGLRFIDDNFKNQSWAGAPNNAWKKRKGNKDAGRALLTKRGALRRSFLAQASVGQARIYTNVPYAKAHNEGFRESVSIPAHTRKITSKVKVQMINEFTKSGKHKNKTIQVHTGDRQVKAHTRKMNIPRRQFAPTASRPSSVLNEAVKKQVRIDMYKILKGK